MRLDLDPWAIFGCNIAKWTILCIVVHFQPVINLLQKGVKSASKTWFWCTPHSLWHLDLDLSHSEILPALLDGQTDAWPTCPPVNNWGSVKNSFWWNVSSSFMWSSAACKHRDRQFSGTAGNCRYFGHNCMNRQILLQHNKKTSVWFIKKHFEV